MTANAVEDVVVFTGAEPGVVRDDPLIIGAVGGSGTRVFMSAAREVGCFMGRNLNKHLDSLPMQKFFRRWSRAWLDDLQGRVQPDSLLFQQILSDLREAAKAHLDGSPDRAGAWGLKVPRSILFLPLLNYAWPRLRFVHVIRNGLDMVYSRNWELKFERDLILRPGDQQRPAAEQAIMLWGRVNEAAADFGEQHLGRRYLRIQFEAMCQAPVETLRRLAEFIGGADEAAVERVAAMVESPRSLGRWRERPAAEVHAIMQAGQSHLEHFGYWNPQAWQQVRALMQRPGWQRYLVQRAVLRRLPA
jgi:hypothetical protein